MLTFGSLSQLGCFRLFQGVLGLFKVCFVCVLLFEVPSDLQVGSSCAKLLKFVFNCFWLFLIVSNCFRLFAFVFEREKLLRMFG